MVSHDEAGKLGDGQTYATVYSSSFLNLFYDYYVLSFNMRFWGCPTSVLLPFFTENFSRNHLDCGVATGWFPSEALGRPFRKHGKQQLTLVDINPNSLKVAETRVLAVTTATTTQCFEADATLPPPAALADKKFTSISMFNLFHCMPGGKEKFAKTFATFSQLLAKDGVLSGCTVLGPKATTSWMIKFYLKFYNDWWGVFNNKDDTREDLEEALKREFEEVEITLVGVMLLFRATKPRTEMNLVA
ncbi:methyltransferase [Trichoderma barbatum]